MPSRFSISLIAVTIIILFAFPRPVRALPPMPASLYGTVKLNGKNIPDGTLVEALIDGLVMAQAYTETFQGKSVYSISVNGDDNTTPAKDGGVDGDEIILRVGGLTAIQKAEWHSSTNTELNLIISSDSTLQTPLPSPKPVFTQTAIEGGLATPAPVETGINSDVDVTGSGLVKAFLSAAVIVMIAAAGFWIFRKKK